MRHIRIVDLQDSDKIRELSILKIKTRLPKIFGIGKTLDEAVEDAFIKINRIGRFGNYQYAIVHNIVALKNSALTYVYPTVVLYRTESE